MVIRDRKLIILAAILILTIFGATVYLLLMNWSNVGETILKTEREEVLVIPTREVITVRVLLVSPTSASKGVLVLFVGSKGIRGFTEKGDRVGYTANFLSRSTPLFVAQGYAVLLINAPSDQPNGMDDSFRTSPQHAEDSSRIIDYLIAKNLKPIFLVGTSKGTISVENFASTYPKDNRIR